LLYQPVINLSGRVEILSLALSVLILKLKKVTLEN